MVIQKTKNSEKSDLSTIRVFPFFLRVLTQLFISYIL